MAKAQGVALIKNQPRLKSEGEANAELLESAHHQRGVKHSITIVDQGFAEPDSHDTTYQEIAVKLKISGSLESITRWLVETQQPANFQGISSLDHENRQRSLKDHLRTHRGPVLCARAMNFLPLRAVAGAQRLFFEKVPRKALVSLTANPAIRLHRR